MDHCTTDIDRARQRFQELMQRDYLTPDELEEIALLTAYITSYIVFSEVGT